MAISAEAVKDLRERTGAGFMDCKRALEEAGGDVEKAVTTLREAGLAAAAKKAGRDAREGSSPPTFTLVVASASCLKSTAKQISLHVTNSSRSL